MTGRELANRLYLILNDAAITAHYDNNVFMERLGG